jgi:hypothetical protein
LLLALFLVFILLMNPSESDVKVSPVKRAKQSDAAKNATLIMPKPAYCNFSLGFDPWSMSEKQNKLWLQELNQYERFVLDLFLQHYPTRLTQMPLPRPITPVNYVPATEAQIEQATKDWDRQRDLLLETTRVVYRKENIPPRPSAKPIQKYVKVSKDQFQIGNRTYVSEDSTAFVETKTPVAPPKSPQYVPSSPKEAPNSTSDAKFVENVDPSKPPLVNVPATVPLLKDPRDNMTYVAALGRVQSLKKKGTKPKRLADPQSNRSKKKQLAKASYKPKLPHHINQPPPNVAMREDALLGISASAINDEKDLEMRFLNLPDPPSTSSAEQASTISIDGTVSAVSEDPGPEGPTPTRDVPCLLSPTQLAYLKLHYPSVKFRRFGNENMPYASIVSTGAQMG